MVLSMIAQNNILRVGLLFFCFVAAAALVPFVKMIFVRSASYFICV